MQIAAIGSWWREHNLEVPDGTEHCRSFQCLPTASIFAKQLMGPECRLIAPAAAQIGSINALCCQGTLQICEENHPGEL